MNFCAQIALVQVDIEMELTHDKPANKLLFITSNEAILIKVNVFNCHGKTGAQLYKPPVPFWLLFLPDWVGMKSGAYRNGRTECQVRILGFI